MIDGVASQPIIRVETSAQVLSTAILENLELRGAARGAAVYAGGQLTLNNVLVVDNRDGGVLVEGGALVTNASTSIERNGAWVGEPPPTGGGILCTNDGLLDVRGRIFNNFAELGGGLALYSGCDAELRPGTIVDSNYADSNGGGIYVTGGATVVGNGLGDAIDIFGNYATRGGGVYIGGSALVVLQDAAFNTNGAAVDGGAIYALNGAVVNLSASVGCAGTSPCNRIWGNYLSDDAGRGSAVYAMDAAVTLRRLRVDHNQASFPQFRVPLFYASGPTGSLVLENLVVDGNRATNLVEAELGADVTAAYVSTAANSYENGGIFPAAMTAIGSGTSVGVFSSILWDLQAFFVSAGAALQLDCVITNTAIGVPPAPASFAVSNVDPLFVAATLGNLRVVPASPAVDYCDLGGYPNPGVDFDGLLRPVDRTDNPNGTPGVSTGTADVGAFELQADASPFLFADGFESGDLSAWSASVGG